MRPELEHLSVDLYCEKIHETRKYRSPAKRHSYGLQIPAKLLLAKQDELDRETHEAAMMGKQGEQTTEIHHQP